MLEELEILKLLKAQLDINPKRCESAARTATMLHTIRPRYYYSNLPQVGAFYAALALLFHVIFAVFGCTDFGYRLCNSSTAHLLVVHPGSQDAGGSSFGPAAAGAAVPERILRAQVSRNLQGNPRPVCRATRKCPLTEQSLRVRWNRLWTRKCAEICTGNTS